jgi:hypothetical protein
MIVTNQYRARLTIEQLLPPPEDKPYTNSTEMITSIELRADDLHDAVQQIAKHVDTLATCHTPTSVIKRPSGKFGYLASTEEPGS